MSTGSSALQSKNLMDVITEFYTEHYADAIEQLRRDDLRNHLQVDFRAIEEFDEDLAERFANNAEVTLYNAEQALSNLVEDDDETGVDTPQLLITNYERINPSVRDLRDKHLGKLISIDGIISKTTSVLPKADTAVFECTRGHQTTVNQPFDPKLEYPRQCSADDCDYSGQQSFRLNVGLSDKINFQKIEVQEPQDELVGGQTPESITFNVEGELAGRVSAGDRVSAVGIYTGMRQGDTSILKTYVRGAFVEPEEQELEEIEITDEEKERIRDISNKDNTYEMLRESIAPNLYGLENEKEAVLYQLFRGLRKTQISTNIRGDIHLLMVGDPGTGKSQLLRYASKLAPRGIMTNGKGASEAGLTAAAVRDAEFGGEDEWTLKAGALVLADKGVACVDELDKMNSSDRSAMHEGLEQQTISVSKAGINATLKSRCALLAAANPKDGRWDEFKPVPEQINLEPALVSRFDLIFAPQDNQSEEHDEKLAKHILKTNQRGQQMEAEVPVSEKSDDVEPDIGVELFRKYIAHARKVCTPVMTDGAKSKLQEFFKSIRENGADDENVIPVTARKIEALVRIAEAAARIRLGSKVREQDADRAIDIVTASLMEVGYDEEAGQFDVDKVEAGQSSTQRDRKNRFLTLVEEMEDEGDKGAPADKIREQLIDEGHREDRVITMINTMKRKGQVYEPTNGEFKLM